jgi:FkbM family methyltransferase
VTRLLRWLRARLSAAIAAAVSAFPALERPYIAIGRPIADRVPLLGTIYWFSQEDLLPRLRASHRNFRALDVLGVPVTVDIGDRTGRLHHFYGSVYEPLLTRAIVECLSPGDVFLDVGANIGFFSVLAAKRVGPAGRVIAFEPHPEARAALGQLVAANGLTGRIDVVDAAVGASRQDVRLFVTLDPTLSTVDPSRAPLGDAYPFTRTIDVPMVSLDGWLAAHPDLRARVRAFKIDVEGAEADVVDGLAETLQATPPAFIFCETSPGSPADAMLRARGYGATTLDVPPGHLFGNYQYTRPAR